MRPKRDSSYGCIKALLLLGRVSNLPSVWSNCLAAWLLAGGALVESADQQRFAWLIAGATLLFLAGMFLNDAFDVQFDREHRPERPIPSGAITAKTVWVLGIGQLLLGLACLVWVNTLATLCALGLATSILLYDWLHKRTVWSPMLMGLCRLFLYLLAAATTTEPLGLTVVLCAFALWAYIVGLSNIARREASGGRVNSWPCWLLGLPLALAFALPYWDGGADVSWRGVVVAAALYALWTVRSLLFTFKSMMPQHGRTVSGLLAGIVLFDFLLAANQNIQMGVVFFGLFGLALLFQRYIPAT
ncbi:UbiA family prenyltransferase [Verrucomicrobia bacterium]|nr:UbiA family prenyltransferase [Verrucomicrobiota bacterium]